MTFGQAIASGFKNYVGFYGRACRSEYWFWALFVFIAGILLGIIDAVLFPDSPSGLFGPLFSIGVLLPGLAVGVRRLHDINKSGWWLLLWFIPIIGWIILIVWAIRRGDEGTNRFGPDPLAGAAAQPV